MRLWGDNIQFSQIHLEAFVLKRNEESLSQGRFLCYHMPRCSVGHTQISRSQALRACTHTHTHTHTHIHTQRRSRARMWAELQHTRKGDRVHTADRAWPTNMAHIPSINPPFSYARPLLRNNWKKKNVSLSLSLSKLQAGTILLFKTWFLCSPAIETHLYFLSLLCLTAFRSIWKNSIHVLVYEYGVKRTFLKLYSKAVLQHCPKQLK